MDFRRGKKKDARGKREVSFLFLISSFFLLAACGFHPQYGTNKYTPYGVEEYLQLVQIEGIPDREGQYLRNALIDRFYRSGRPSKVAYILSLSRIEEQLIDLDITKDSDSTRGQLRLKTTMVLRKATTGEELLKRNLLAITSYNILGSEFATRVTEQAARENALDDLASQVELQIGLWLKRQ